MHSKNTNFIQCYLERFIGAVARKLLSISAFAGLLGMQRGEFSSFNGNGSVEKAMRCQTEATERENDQRYVELKLRCDKEHFRSK